MTFDLRTLPALLQHTRLASVCFYPPPGGFFLPLPQPQRWPGAPKGGTGADQARLNGVISRILSHYRISYFHHLIRETL